MSDVQLFSFPYNRGLPRLAAAEGLFLFGIKKKQKMPAENFSLKAVVRLEQCSLKNLLGRI
jgi:hypothetical protein